MGCEMICCNTNDMMFAWRDPSASTAWWIHSSFIAWFCSLQLKLLTNDQMALFLGGDSKGPGAVWTYPGVTKIENAKFEAIYGENWKRRYTYTFLRVICMNLSFTTCYTSNFSPIDTAVIMSECCVLLLVVCNLHCAMVTPLVQLNSSDENTNIGFRAHHQHVRNYVWSWDTYNDHWLEELLVSDLDYLLFWQSAWWNRGLIQQRGRSRQVPCRSSFVFPFLWS